MRTAYIVILALFAVGLSQPKAEAAQAQIVSLYCQGFQPGVGGGVFTFLGGNNFNLVESNAFGVPLLSQDLFLTSADFSTGIYVLNFGSTVKPELTYTLRLPRNGGISRFSTALGSMDVNCTSVINANP